VTKSKQQAFHRALSAWYRTQGRHDLPWRQTNDAYPIWISEVMLQQTQVATVLARFYHPFLERFPTIEALASASEEQVLKHWQGLGYYSRARNLHKAAQLTAPALPDTAEGLLALPGIGKNTAHAILAFGFRRPVAISEANVKRVIARIFALETPTDAELWDKAHALLNEDDAFDYNQAMMDLGAMVCTPKNPDCSSCPAAVICAGQKDPLRYPQKKAKKVVPIRRHIMLIRRDRDGRLFLQPRETRFLGGLYGFPQEEAASFIPEKNDRKLGSVTHIYSHFRLEADVWLREEDQRANSPDWHDRDTIAALPLSGADIRALTVVWPDFRSALPPSAA
jgi:A/G-specific adenine glycosylase